MRWASVSVLFIASAAVLGCTSEDQRRDQSGLEFPSLSSDFENRGLEIGQADLNNEVVVNQPQLTSVSDALRIGVSGNENATMQAAATPSSGSTRMVRDADFISSKVPTKITPMTAVAATPQASQAPVKKGPVRDLGNALQAGQATIGWPFPKNVAEAALQGAAQNAETYKVNGQEVTVGRATVSNKSASLDYIVIFADPALAGTTISMKDSIVPFARRATGCNVNRRFGSIASRPDHSFTENLVLPLDCRNSN